MARRNNAKAKAQKERLKKNAAEAKRLINADRGGRQRTGRIRETPAGGETNGGSNKIMGGSPTNGKQGTVDMSHSTRSGKQGQTRKPKTIKDYQQIAGELYRRRVEARKIERESKSERYRKKLEYTNLTREATKRETQLNNISLRYQDKDNNWKRNTPKRVKDTHEKLTREYQEIQKQRETNANERRGLSNKITRNKVIAEQAEKRRVEQRATIEALRTKRTNAQVEKTKQAKAKAEKQKGKQSKQSNQTDDTQNNTLNVDDDQTTGVKDRFIGGGGDKASIAASNAITAASGGGSIDKFDIYERNTARMLETLENKGYQVRGKSPIDYLYDGGDPADAEMVAILKAEFETADGKPITGFIYHISEQS